MKRQGEKIKDERPHHEMNVKDLVNNLITNSHIHSRTSAQTREIFPLLGILKESNSKGPLNSKSASM